MNRLALFPLLLLAAADAPRPEPERQKLPAAPEREKELLRPLQALPELPTSHQLTTAIRDTWQQGREIAGYLLTHDAEKGRELHLHRLALLDAAGWMRDDLRELKRAAAQAHPIVAAPVQRPPEPTPAPPRAQPGHIRAPKPKPPPVRCPVRHCQAKPGARCRGHSGEAMATIHPERERAAKRLEIS